MEIFGSLLFGQLGQDRQFAENFLRLVVALEHIFDVLDGDIAFRCPAFGLVDVTEGPFPEPSIYLILVFETAWASLRGLLLSRVAKDGQCLVEMAHFFC